MTTVPLERTDLEILESLDFEHVPPCEHYQHADPGAPHGGPGHVLVRVHCPACPFTRSAYLCRPWWEYVTTSGDPGSCRKCGALGSWRDFYTVLSWVNQ